MERLAWMRLVLAVRLGPATPTDWARFTTPDPDGFLLNPAHQYSLGIRQQFGRENPAMLNPSAGIGDVENGTAPTRIRRSAIEVASDRSDQAHDHVGLKVFDSSTQQTPSIKTQRPPSLRIESIHRGGAQVDQIATRLLEHVEEVLVADCRVGLMKNAAERPIQAGIGTIEELAGGGWRFADEKDANPSREKSPS